MSMVSGYWRSVFVVALGLSVAGCGLPPSMRYATGVEPNYEDDDVRFRTIYYFRVLDYCDRPQSANVATDAQAFPFADGGIRNIQKDSLYRFRMTGKASSLFSRVHFEAGTLKAHQIDPFGADVAFDETNRRFFVRSSEESQAAARFAASRTRIEDLRRMVEDLASIPDVKNDVIERLRAAIKSIEIDGMRAPVGDRVALAIAAHRAGYGAVVAMVAAVKDLASAAPASGASQNSDSDQAKDFKAAISGIKYEQPTDNINEVAPKAVDSPEEALAQIALTLAEWERVATTHAKKIVDEGKKYAELVGAEKAKPDALLDAANKANGVLKAQLGRLGDARKIVVAALARAPAGEVVGGNPSGDCPPGSRFRRGFQVLGPEGLRTFDPDDRLMLAMTTDAKPLISALNDISGRVLGGKVSSSAARLPVADERTALRAARSALDRHPAAEPKEAADMIDATVKALRGEKP